MPGDSAVTPEINELGANAGVSFFDYQVEFLTAAQSMDWRQRVCLYYRTGAGKTITSLSGLTLWGQTEAAVIAPPSTHTAWEQWGAKFGIEVQAMSHAKFRMKDTRLSRHTAVIVDEFHMLGGHGGLGWKKLDRLAGGLQAPLVALSATPNYNDAERVYCIQRILDPASCAGGYLEFLYRECNTRQNPYGMTPLVDDDEPFRRFANAAEYLAALPGVFYLPDDVVYQIVDVPYSTPLPAALETYGYNGREHRMVASLMEERHTRTSQQLVDEDGFIHGHVYELLADIAGGATTPLLVYANHATVAEALTRTLRAANVSHALVTGKTSKGDKDWRIDEFRKGHVDVLVGTASLATGTDGLDKVCDWLVILDDTDDDAARRQLIGRIMPRGEASDASNKHVLRLVHV